jgi:peptide/nickel transport system permease protein
VSTRYLAGRVGSALVTILLLVLINFVLFRAMPGSPERVAAGRHPGVSPQMLANMRERWGLDKPLYPVEITGSPPYVAIEPDNQLFRYLVSLAAADLGVAFSGGGQTVVEAIGQRIYPTLILFGLGEAIAILLGLGLGAYSGWKRGGALDYVGNGMSLVLYSMPYFLIGMGMLLVFATALGWFPTYGMTTPGAQFDSPIDRLLDLLSHLVLPVATVAIGLIGQYSILMRSSVIETLDEDYVITARAKGLRDRHVLRRHAFPNALLPAVTLIAINLGYVVAGAITVEVVFNWPGLGTLTVEALEARDYPLLQGIFLLLSVAVVFANLGADIVYGHLDPRVRT